MNQRLFGQDKQSLLVQPHIKTTCGSNRNLKHFKGKSALKQNNYTVKHSFRRLKNKFDAIHTSNQSDVTGPVNLLNAVRQKLRSEHSILYTENMTWTQVAPNGTRFIEKMLCCPLNLIPTLYGFRLLNDSFDSNGRKCRTLMGCRWLPHLR